MVVFIDMNQTPSPMKKTNQTPAQILNLLRESETRDPERHADKTVVLKDDEKTTTETFGFFKAEAHKRPTDAGWSYDDQIEPGNEIHIWRTNYDKPGDRTTPETTTLVFETSHEARTQAADHLETIVREAGMTRTDAYRDNAKGTDHARYTLEVPADQADDTGRSIALDMTANGIRTSWHVATEPGPDPNPEATPADPTEAASRLNQADNPRKAQDQRDEARRDRDHYRKELINALEDYRRAAAERNKHEDDQTPPAQAEIDQALVKIEPGKPNNQKEGEEDDE